VPPFLIAVGIEQRAELGARRRVIPIARVLSSDEASIEQSIRVWNRAASGQLALRRIHCEAA
jgi:hypothetical protein